VRHIREVQTLEDEPQFKYPVYWRFEF